MASERERERERGSRATKLIETLRGLSSSLTGASSGCRRKRSRRASATRRAGATKVSTLLTGSGAHFRFRCFLRSRQSFERRDVTGWKGTQPRLLFDEQEQGGLRILYDSAPLGSRRSTPHSPTT